MNAFDLIVIGGGPGGYTAAIRATQLGAKVALVEKTALGGTCLNRGCIPTKTLIASAHLLQQMKHADEFGIEGVNPIINWPKLLERKTAIINKLVTGLTGLIKGLGIEIITGEADLNDLNPAEVKIKNAEGVNTYSAKKIILATGSEPASIAGFAIDHQRIIDSTDALNLPALPKTMAIIGGGVMGVEFASLFAILGVEVTIYEMMERILPKEDSEISQTLERIFKRYGITVKAGVKVSSSDLSEEKILITIGRKLNLASGKTNPNVFAVGDITGKHMTAHGAYAQGKIAAATACLETGIIAEMPEEIKSELNYDLIPQAIYTLPEIGRVGLNSDQLTKSGTAFKTGKYPFAACSRALIIGERDGFVKIYTDAQSGVILGAHLIGPDASEMIHELAVAIKNNLSIEEVISTVHAHPSLSESVQEAAENIFGQAISIKNSAPERK
jgi:dihydrolipoamide dehydrogenase